MKKTTTKTASTVVLPRATYVRIRELSSAVGQTPDEIVDEAIRRHAPRLARKGAAK